MSMSNVSGVSLMDRLIAAERTAGVLRAANAHLRKKLDAALLARDEARESRNEALKQRDEYEQIVNNGHIALADATEANRHLQVRIEALKGIVQNLHDRAVAATEALGVVYGPAGNK